MYLSDRPVEVAQAAIQCAVMQLLETLAALTDKPGWCDKDAAEVKRWQDIYAGFVSECEAEWRKFDFAINLFEDYVNNADKQIEWLKEEREKYRG